MQPNLLSERNYIRRLPQFRSEKNSDFDTGKKFYLPADLRHHKTHLLLY